MTGPDASPAATHPLIGAVAQRLRLRDRRQMQIVDRLLSAITSPPARLRLRRRKTSAAEPWHGFRAILCAIDFSKQSRVALRYAAAMAARHRSVLRVVYVNDPLLTAAAAAALHDRKLVARSAVELRQFVEATIPQRARRTFRVTPQVRIGNPAIEILGAAAATGTDLIVLGTEGLTGARRVILGSTARQLLRQSQIPILVIPPPRGRRPIRPSPSWPGEWVMAALDLGRQSEVQVEFAAHLAASFHAALVLVVADQVVQLAAKQHPTLVLVPLHASRRSLIDRRGSVAYKVLAHAGAPMLAYPVTWQQR
jgi:nucleotide-binding universal stress UspA family protein